MRVLLYSIPVFQYFKILKILLRCKGLASARNFFRRKGLVVHANKENSALTEPTRENTSFLSISRSLSPASSTIHLSSYYYISSVFILMCVLRQDLRTSPLSLARSLSPASSYYYICVLVLLYMLCVLIQQAQGLDPEIAATLLVYEAFSY
jgi:hypothetical protein